RSAGARLILIRGGVRQAIAPLARALGFADPDVFAVSIGIDAKGNYESLERSSPLATQRGKPEVLERLIADRRLIRPILAVGDGATDVPLRSVADSFAAYVGFARRTSVVAHAHLEIASFAQLASVVLGGARG